MTNFPKCSALPDDVVATLNELAQLWAKNRLRPKIPHSALDYWNHLIAEWSECQDLPLLIRKAESGVARGEIIQHETGRELVITDNSPAGWAFYQAFTESQPTLADIRLALDNGSLPIAMVIDRQMKERSQYKGCRVTSKNPNSLGWKVCHKRSIGLGGRELIKNRTISDLKNHFRAFLSPSNMFVLPLIIGGLGETELFIKAIMDDDAL